MCVRAFDKIFSLDQIGSGQAMAELTAPMVFKMVKLLCFSASIQYCINTVGACYCMLCQCGPSLTTLGHRAPSEPFGVQ